MMEKLLALYHTFCGEAPAKVETLKEGGSNRAYYRLTAVNGHTLIGVIGTSAEENRAFLYLARYFAAVQLPVPVILAESEDALVYLQTDLGNTSLFDALKEGRTHGGNYSEDEIRLLETTIRLLPVLQVKGAAQLDWNMCYPQPCFDADNVLFDLNYLKYCFLKVVGLDFHETKLEQDFRAFAAALTAEQDTCFMYRDFQARNVMLDAAGNPSFIDFQGGRRGPYYYDVASFLWQASTNYSNTLRKHLMAVYHEALGKLIAVPTLTVFTERLQDFVLLRTLQVLGAYGFRGYFERKQYFIDSIPGAIANLRELLTRQQLRSEYPYLFDVLQRLTALPRFESKKPVKDAQKTLHVKVFSFSYHRGIPHDASGNGGGYVFDCRAIHNPGRYEPYKKLTGLDAPVIQFLEDNGEITEFLDVVYRLADKHVARYLERGFTSLMFSFGCTGGQHRSVYSAQHLAEHLHQKFGIDVTVEHREQHITQHFAATQ